MNKISVRQTEDRLYWRFSLARRSRSGYQPGRLFAWRCPDCKLDQVTDLSGVVWDLNDDDYTDEGSYAK